MKYDFSSGVNDIATRPALFFMTFGSIIPPYRLRWVGLVNPVRARHSKQHHPLRFLDGFLSTFQQDGTLRRTELDICGFEHTEQVVAGVAVGIGHFFFALFATNSSTAVRTKADIGAP